jgi:cellulose synthase/poly-beta-1,6-N-acetylglucosamine synthase-like glycosyltransferase
MSKKNVGSAERALIHKKFVTGRTLILVVVISFLYLFLQVIWLKNIPLYQAVILEFCMLLLVWHKVYQVVYDLKLLFFFDGKYDPELDLPKRLPAITFIIPSYQEPFGVAKMTFDSILTAPYDGRKEIIVVDNSRDTSAEDFINWKAYVENCSLMYPDSNVTATFLYNEKNAFLKPGNLDVAQRHIKEGEFVVFLDVDSTLPDTENLLERSIAEFETDGKLGFLQFRMKGTNAHFNDLTQSVSTYQDLFRLRAFSRGYGGYKIFDGHNGMWRKTVLDKIDAWTDFYRGDIIITEDLLKSAYAYAKGYYGKPLNVVTGEWVPNSLKALESMWMRWIYGSSQVVFKYFKSIYASRIPLLEKFDVSYHITLHLNGVFLFLLAFILQLSVPGPITNIFVFTMIIFPQLIGAFASYFIAKDKKRLPFMKKMRILYAGFFLIDTFVLFIQVKSVIKFILRVPQGWKVTEKGVERSMGWKSIIRGNIFHIGTSLLTIGVCAVSWITNYDMSLPSLLHHFALLYVSVNLLACILVFGKQNRNTSNDEESATICNTRPMPALKPGHYVGVAVDS